MHSETLIPIHLRTKLKLAVAAYSLNKVIEVVEDIESIDTDIARTIRHLAQEFDFASIEAILERE